MNPPDLRTLMSYHLRELGFDIQEPNWETILLDQGQFGGRRYEFDDVHVYWFATRKSLEFYSADWNLLKMVDLAVVDAPATATATQAAC